MGLAGDAKVASLREAVTPVVYLPALQGDRTGPVVVHVRTSVDSATVAASVRDEARRLHPDVTVRLRTLDEEVAWTEQPARQLAVALALLASVALVLTVVGLHGTMAYAALRRTGEFGIRFALGATRGDVLLAIVRESLGIVSMGSALGVAGTLALAPVLGRLLYHVGRIDAPSAVAAVLAAVAAGVVAAAAPAWQASRIDPAPALRHE